LAASSSSIPLGDVVLKVGAGSPEQIEIHEIGTIGPTVTVKVLVNAQGAGNRIWCENIIACSHVLVFTLTGAQVPVIAGLSSELVGKSVVVSLDNMIFGIELKSGVIVEVPQGTTQVNSERSQGYVV
jgi:hypothetical protein